MKTSFSLTPLFALAIIGTCSFSNSAQGCAAVFRLGKPVVNADQTVIIVWDQATSTEHFIRQASFKSDAEDFGFLVPSPNQPELAESGNEAFPYLQQLTEPPVTRSWPLNPVTYISCSMPVCTAPPEVHVLEEKRVAGFHAVVLEATSATALVNWLRDNGYTYSPEVEAWAKPYVEAGWKITALKVAKGEDARQDRKVAASALRMSFKTDRPLFPYREPDSTEAAKALGAKDRLLRIYFIAEARYQGELTRENLWTGKVAWAGKLSTADRTKLLELLKLPTTTGPAQWWLTEFEDHWPYRVAPADLYFSRATDQKPVKRVALSRSGWPTDVMTYAIAAVVFGPPLLRRVRNSKWKRFTSPGCSW